MSFENDVLKTPKIDFQNYLCKQVMVTGTAQRWQTCRVCSLISKGGFVAGSSNSKKLSVCHSIIHTFKYKTHSAKRIFVF